MGSTSDIITACATVAAVLLAAAAIWIEGRRLRLSRGVDLMLKLDEQFNSEYMRERRRAAARSLMNRPDEEVDDVLDFFEVVGMLVRRTVLDEEVAWSIFFHWLHRYYLCAREYVTDYRKNSPTTWEDFEYLHCRVLAVHKRKNPKNDREIMVSEEELRQFLLDEAELNMGDRGSSLDHNGQGPSGRYS